MEHIQHVYDEGELDEAATCRDFRQVRQEGSRRVTRRVKSVAATKFRIWATERLKEYLVQGAAINPRRLEQLGSIVELLQRPSPSAPLRHRSSL